MKRNEMNILEKIEYKKQKLAIIADVIQYCEDSKRYYESNAASETDEYSLYLRARINAMNEIIELLEKEV